MSNQPTEPQQDEMPPFFSTWKQIYTAVLVHLVLWMVFFYWFTQYFK